MVSFYRQFGSYKTIVEIGVQFGETTAFLCDAARMTGGKVFGYDYFEPIGVYTTLNAPPMDVAEKTILNSGAKRDTFKLTKVDTTSDDFNKILLQDTNGVIDFAFIDGDHSYNGVKNDFLKVYPYLIEDGIIAFHDTYTHAGCRKFVLELYNELNDGTFDIINLPFSEGGHGLTILSKRSYQKYQVGILTAHEKDISYDEIYRKEKEWYLKQTNKL